MSIRTDYGKRLDRFGPSATLAPAFTHWQLGDNSPQVRSAVVSGSARPFRSLARVVRDSFGTRDLARLELAWACTSAAHWSGVVALAV